MVFIFDDEGVFDASLERVWRFMRVHKDYPHPHHINASREGLGENSYISNYEFKSEGLAIRIKYKGTLHPPLGLAMDFVGGTFEGSKLFQYFSPASGKTRVTIVDYLVSPSLSEDEACKAFSRFGETDFEEDQVAISKLD